jgi:DNA repair exonuclease SbcCD ATPase subunit
MKKIVLRGITLRNFRGEKERVTLFYLDRITTLAGANGLGKSRHFDAFLWLLFGKDAQDRKDFNIKTTVNGEPLPKVDVDVEATLQVGDAEVTLRRVYKEKWVKPRGQVEEVFKGNETETYWNGVPISVSDYQRRISSELVDDTMFKILSNPHYFATMKWQDQREQLFQLAGTISDNEIAEKNKEFAALLDKISGKSFADFKREVAARKKRLKDDLAQVQPRIDQTQKMMPETLDFEALEKEIESIDTQLADIDKAIASKSAAIRQQYEAVQGKQSALNKLKQEQQSILFSAKENAREAAFKANSARRDLENNIKVAETEISTLKDAIVRNERDAQELKERIERKINERDALRQTWHDENNKEFSGDDICHTCGQPLPEEIKADARKLFIDAKTKKLAEITENGKKINESAVQLDADADKLVAKDKELNNKLSEQSNVLSNLKDELARTPIANETQVDVNTLPEYLQISYKISNMEKEISEMESGEPADNTELQQQKKELQQQRDEAKGKLTNRELIGKYTNEISDLEKKGKDLAQKIADAEREEYTMQQFSRKRIEECEKRINSLFSYVTFKLFDYTIDGNEFECCIPLVNGVSYETKNSAGQINAGLDIIRTMAQFYGVTVPIFIDNAESVNNLLPMESQVIRLEVTNDKILTIK